MREVWNVRLDAAAKRLLGVAIVVVGPDGQGVDVDGPRGLEEIGQLLLKLGLVVVPLVPDCIVSAKGSPGIPSTIGIGERGCSYRSCGGQATASRQAEGGPF